MPWYASLDQAIEAHPEQCGRLGRERVGAGGAALAYVPAFQQKYRLLFCWSEHSSIPAFQQKYRLLFCWNAGLINGGGSCRVVLESPAYPSAGRLERRRARLPVGAIGLFGPVAPAVALGVGRGGQSRVVGLLRRVGLGGRRSAGSMALQRFGGVWIVRTASWTPFAVPFPEGKMDPERPSPQRAAGRAGGATQRPPAGGHWVGGSLRVNPLTNCFWVGVSCSR